MATTEQSLVQKPLAQLFRGGCILYVMCKDRRGAKGFTLVEILTVIAIIGILSAVVMVSMSGSQKKGRDGRRVSDVNQIRLALSLYYDAHNYYPSGSTASTAFGTVLSALQSEGFIGTLPNDPMNGTGNTYGYIATNCTSGSNCGGYVLGADLEVPNAVLTTSHAGSQAIRVNGTTDQNCSGSNVPPNYKSYTVSGVTYYLYCATN